MTAISNANLPVSNGSGDAALAHVQSTRVIGSTTIATDTIANWPSFFIATTGTLLANGFIDPTSKTDFYGHLGVGNQLIIDGYCPGNTDNGNTSGQVVVIKPNTEWANLIAQGVQSTSNFPSLFANFVEPAGGVWSISSGLVGVQTVGNAWYQGVRYSIPAVATHTFTASQDTYVDINPATGAYTYVPVTNGAAEPAVTASNVRVAKIITGASAITSITQRNYQSPVGLSNINFDTYQSTLTPVIMSTWSTANFGTTETSLGTIAVPIPNGAVAVEIFGMIQAQNQDNTQHDNKIYMRDANNTSNKTNLSITTQNATFNGGMAALVGRIPVVSGETTMTLDLRAFTSSGLANSGQGWIMIKPVYY